MKRSISAILLAIVLLFAASAQAAKEFKLINDQSVPGATGKVDVSELANPGGVDLSAWKGASSGLLDRADVDEIAAAIQPGSVAAVVVYENRWVLSLVSTWRRDGARFIADGGISASDVIAALDATEPS